MRKYLSDRVETSHTEEELGHGLAIEFTVLWVITPGEEQTWDNPGYGPEIEPQSVQVDGAYGDDWYWGRTEADVAPNKRFYGENARVRVDWLLSLEGLVRRLLSENEYEEQALERAATQDGEYWA